MLCKYLSHEWTPTYLQGWRLQLKRSGYLLQGFSSELPEQPVENPTGNTTLWEPPLDRSVSASDTGLGAGYHTFLPCRSGQPSLNLKGTQQLAEALWM